MPKTDKKVPLVKPKLVTAIGGSGMPNFSPRTFGSKVGGSVLKSSPRGFSPGVFKTQHKG